MKQPCAAVLQERKIDQQLVPLISLPQWEYVPATCQRELVMALASILLKRIPTHCRPQGRKGDE
jgi:hypothetical protein